MSVAGWAVVGGAVAAVLCLAVVLLHRATRDDPDERAEAEQRWVEWEEKQR